MSFLGEAVVGVGADTSAFEGETKRAVETASANAAKTMQNAGRKMTSVGTSLTAKVTAPILGVAAASLKVAGDFEQTMNVLQTATGAPAKAMADMRKQAIDLGRDTVFSANESAEAMLELGKAGLTSKQTMAAVPEVLNLAATEGLGLAQSAGIVTSAMAPFQLKAENVGEAVNALAGASNASKASVATLSEALKLVGGAAAGTGLTVQETTGALAALAQNGLEGGIAGTSLAGVLRRLQPQTEKAGAAMEQLGLDFVKGNGEFESIDNIAGQLQETFKGMPAAARQAKLSAIFGNDASVMQAVNALINTGAEGMRDFTKASSDQTAASSLAEARMKGMKGSIEAMKGSIETAGLAIGTILIPYVTKAADFIGTMADKFGTLSPQVQKVVIVVGLIAAAIGPVLIVVGSLITAVGTIAGVFAGLTAAVAAPIAAFVLIGAAIAVFFAKSEAARTMVVTAFNEIKTAIMSAVGPIVEMIQGQMMPAFDAMWPIIEKVGLIFLSVFTGAVVGAVKGAIKVITGIVQVITGVVQVISGVLTGDWGKAWDGVKNIVKGATKAIIGVIQVWLNVGILGIFRKGFSLLTGIIRGGWNLMKSIFKSGVNAAKSVVQGGWNAIKGATSSVWNGIKAVISTVWGAIKGAVTGSLAAIRGAFSNGWNALKGIVSNAWNGISTAVRNGVTKAVNFVKELPGKAKAALGNIGSTLISAGTDLIGGFIKGITSKFGEVQDMLSNLTSKLPDWKGPAETDRTILFESGVLVIEGFVAGLESNIPMVRTTLGEFTDLVANSFTAKEMGKAISAVADTFAKINEEIANATQGRADAQLAASEKAFEAERKGIERSAEKREAALKKKYDGKKLRKKLAALERETDASLRKLEAREKKAAREIEKTRKDSTSSLQAMAGAHRAVINSIANAWDSVDLQLNGEGGIRDQLADARSTLESEIDKMLSYASSVGGRLVESVFKAPTDVRLPVKFEDLVADLQAQEAQAEAFGNVLADLASMGLNATSYDQIASAGPEALAAAEALVNAGEAGIAQVNALQSSIDAYAAEAGTTAANYLYGAGVSAAQGVVDGLVNQESALVAQMTTLGTALASAITAAISAIQLPGATGGGGGGGGGGGDQGGNKHQWEPKSKTNRNCAKCGKPRNASVHTNRGNNNASGTMSWSGGWGQVNERGPELIKLPDGSRVYPAHQTERMVGSASGGDTININLTMPTDDPEAAAEAMMNRLARRGR